MFKSITQTFTGSDNQLSSRKLTAFMHVVLMVLSTVVLWFKTSGDMVILYCVFGHGLFALLLLGVVTVQNIITFKQGYKPKDQ